MPAIQDSGLQGPTGGDASEETHTVVDGDTLAQLAQRYLGSASRAGELYAYNRDVLSDPELLPIGAELRIPSSATAKATSPMSGQTPRELTAQPMGLPVTLPVVPAAIPNGESPSPLVPVGSAANPASAEPPKLIPLPPTHLAAIPIDHSYVVQPGDTLWSIAQRLYGDGRRSDMLLQANHDRLWNPRDLRPGMTLIVP
jgi:nucleoid-associated protein YgaU